MGIILQFYASIFNQRRFGTLNNKTWRVVHDDLCAFVRREPVQTMWTSRLTVYRGDRTSIGDIVYSHFERAVLGEANGMFAIRADDYELSLQPYSFYDVLEHPRHLLRIPCLRDEPPPERVKVYK